jgi:hypothetical protein
MIFLWGRRNKVLDAYSDENCKCENCNSNNLIYFVNQNYYHLFWIPIVPNNKFAGTYCPDCIESKQVVYSETGARLIKQTRTPIYMYSLLIIFGGLIGLGIINGIDYNIKQKELIKVPTKEDIYTIKFKDNQNQDAYSFIKVVTVSKDSILLVPCDKYYNRDIGYLRSNISFLNDTIRKSRKELLDMYQSDNITEIHRSKSSER